MVTRKKVSVVILAWNGRLFLEKFLPSVIKYSASETIEVVVADNASTDDSVAFVQENYPQVRLIKNTVNEGFASGYNKVLKQIDAEYFILLNQDVEVTEGWIEKVLKSMEEEKDVVAAQPKIRAYHEKDSFEYAGACGGYLDRFGYAFCRGRIFDSIEKDLEQYNTITEIFWATGACLFVKSKTYFKLGGLDDDFFAHQEEIDLCWRIRNTGGKVICVPSSVVYHVGGGSLPQGNPRKTYLNFRNSLMMMFKNLPLSEMLWKVFIVRLSMDGIAAIHSVWKLKSLSDLMAILKAHFAFYISIPALVAKRRAVQNKSSDGLWQRSIVWQYYALRKRKFSDLSNGIHNEFLKNTDCKI
ncbi:MAG: glycosyltransferase family 2 protein [Bacteroidetes bacterium]|nr:glycosyltransferase family 2 protein [Bacteroidota bacterium]